MLRSVKSRRVGVTIIAVTLTFLFWQYVFSVKKTISLRADIVETGLGGPQRSFENTSLQAGVVVETGPGGPQRSFALARSYWEGMTMATFNFMGLVTVAKYWNATTVWPFTKNSYLWGIPVRGPRLGFDLIYDLDDVKQKCANASIPPPVSFEEFLETASRRVVAVIIDWQRTGGTTNRCSEVQKIT